MKAAIEQGRPSVNGARRDGVPTVALVAHAVHDGGGMERGFAELIRRIDSDYRIVVVSTELAPSLRPLVEWLPVPVPRRPFPLRFAAFFVFGGLRLRGVRSDITQTLGAIVPNGVDTATVQFCHAGFLAATGGLAPSEASPLRKLNTSLTRLLALAAERWCYRPSRLRWFVAVSNGIAAELEGRFPGIPAVVAPNGVDAIRYRPDPDARARLRSAQSIPGDDVVVLFVGGDWARKGLPVLIEGLRHAPSVRLWVVGPGEEPRMASLARELGVVERITFFGMRSDTEAFYAASDIFCLPSLYEAYPLAALEAAASGLPIVATAVNGVVDLVGEDEAGLIVDRSAESVGAALERLAQEPSLRVELGRAGSQRAAGHTWDAAAAVARSQYERLLAAKDRT